MQFILIKAAVSSLACALLELDTVQAGQFLVSRPAVAGPLLGWLNGCPLEGARMGILIELIYMDFIPVGGVVPPNGAVAAGAGVMLHALAGLPAPLAFFLALAAGWWYTPVERWLRGLRSGRNAVIEAEVRSGRDRLGFWVAAALAEEFAAVAVYVMLVFAAGAALALVPGLQVLSRPAAFAYSLMPWLGLSGLYFRFRTQIYKKE